MKKVFIWALVGFWTSTAFCDLNHELNSFFDKFGASANATAGDIYNGQKAGYLTGGGITIRNRVMNVNPATVNLPRFDAGCGGIDIFAGGFSFINHDQLISSLKSIGSSATGYAFLLGLETVSPQVANTIKQLQTWANNVNSLNINSCEKAATMVGAVWPKRTLASQEICRSISSSKGKFQDYVSARHNCAQCSQFEGIMNQSDDNQKSLLKDEYNIAWEAIQKQKFLAQNHELAELFMSLMGTVIVRKDAEHCVERWPSKISDSSFLKTLLEGGGASIYSCQKDAQNRCLLIKEKTVQMSPSNVWVGRIRTILMNIQSKILNDEELSQDETQFLAKTTLPVYRVINVLTAYKKGYSPVDLYQIADLIAMDLLNQYLREAIVLVREGAFQLRQSQMYADAIDEYLDDLKRVEETVAYYENRCKGLNDQEFQMMQKILLIEEQLSSEIILK
jgi:conjugative transfer pilus assembly protein TraH